MARKRKVVASVDDDPFAVVPKVEPSSSSDVSEDLLSVVGNLKGWSPAADVLVNVRSVPTCLLGLDRALGVGGFPLGRMYVVHGPSGQGKTTCELALVRSFLERDHLAFLVDAEHTTESSWTDDMLGSVARHPLFRAKRPKTYEETIDGVDEILKALPAAREKRPDLATLIVVDSLNKLTPERELATLRKQGGDAIDKGWGRYRAGLNQAWIDHLTPLLGALDVAILFVAQERTKKDADADDVRYGTDWEIKGGKGVIYDSSLVMRATRAGWIREGDSESENDEEKEKARGAPVIGSRHRVRVHKSKVEWLGNRTDFFFHVTNGADGKPAGFDFARDMLEVGKEVDAIQHSGAWVRWGSHKWNGVAKFLGAVQQARAERAGWLADMEQDVRSRFGKEEGRRG